MRIFGLAWIVGVLAQGNQTQNIASNSTRHISPYNPHAAARPPPQYRYTDATPSRDTAAANFRARARTKIRRSIAVNRAITSPTVLAVTIRQRLGRLLDSPNPNYHPETRALAHYFDSCRLDDLTYEREALIVGWSKIREIEPELAATQLTGISEILRRIFFNLAPAQRAAQWNRLTHASKTDVNLAIDIFDAINSNPLTSTTTAPPIYRIGDAHLHQAFAQALSTPPYTRFPSSESPYLMALSEVLRDLDAANNDFFKDHIAILPSNIWDFVGRAALLPLNAAASTLPDEEYLTQQRMDLAALRYTQNYYKDCHPVQRTQPVLASIHAQFNEAVAAEKHDVAIMANMFQRTGDISLIYHTGISFHNAKGKDINGLVAYLDGQADPAFLKLDTEQKKRLVRIKLYRLQESPDYPIGSVQQTMATILRRMSNQPDNNRYLRYRDRFHLFECWERRYKQWVELRDFELSPELYSAMHMAGSNGVYHCTLSWYRRLWKKKIFDPISNATAVRNAAHEERAALWQWVAARSPGWSADSHRWHAITPERYASAVTGMVEAFYHIKQASDLPRFEVIDIYGAGFTRYHASLSALSVPIRQAITDLAKDFKSSALSVEIVLADDWLTTSYRLLESAHYRTALVMQEPPSYSVEVAAYVALLNNGVTHAQMTEASARVFCVMSDNPHQQRLRPAHEAFISIIRNPHSEDLLLLPNGKSIYPHAIINAGFDRYRNGLITNGWVIGRARQNLRDRGVPLFPLLLKAEIESVAAPFHKKASKATVSGTELANYFFGSLPISSPILDLSRAVRAGNYTHAPYYFLVLARDILAVAAMRGALGAAYLTPMKAASRYGSAALLGTSAAGTKRTSGMRSSMRTNNANRDKPQEISFSGDQAHSMQSKIVRRTNQNNAAHHYSASRIENNATSFTPLRFDPDDWKRMIHVLLPSNVKEADRQRQKVRSIVRVNENSLLNITVIEDPDETGTEAGLLGLSRIKANTLCNGEVLSERLTVSGTQEWRLKTDSAHPRPAQDLIGNHITITLDETAEQSWNDYPAQRYDAIALLVTLYEKSPQFRKILHWYDDHAIESHTIAIQIKATYSSANVTSSAAWTTVDIKLPANPERLPFIVNERQMARQTILQATLDSVIAAITRALPPINAMQERGVNIWLSNQIFLEYGEIFVPRINAAFFTASTPWQYQHVRDIAEQEDQYLERIVTEHQLPPEHGRFQGTAVEQRPTVVEAIAVLSQLDYPAYLQSRVPAIAVKLSLPDNFRQRFEKKFEIDPTIHDPVNLEMIHLFLYECYAGSSLFRKLFEYGIEKMGQRWTIYPNGFYGSGVPQHDKLIPFDGMIDASVECAVYLGLVQSTADANTTLATAGPPVQPIESMRRLLDGIVIAMSGLSNNDTTLAPPFDTASHRGAAVWMTDVILWQAGWMANKRLARIILPDSPGIENITRLAASAGANRRAARVEDAYLMAWLNQK